MNYKSFTQIVILGSSTFVPFMQLTAANRRDVIEDLLDIRIFSSMNNLIKDKIRNLKEEVKVLDLKKESLTDKVQMQENFIEQIESKSHEDIAIKEKNIGYILNEENNLMNHGERLNEKLISLEESLEKHIQVPLKNFAHLGI